VKTEGTAAKRDLIVMPEYAKIDDLMNPQRKSENIR
jgi:hypothetical protein